jgi:hypothetical protein
MEPVAMSLYIARFSYSVLPVHRPAALAFLQQELAAARRKQLNARVLVPLTRGEGGAALQFELEMSSLDQMEQFRERGMESPEQTAEWMRGFSEILLSPPAVELLRVQEPAADGA